MQNEKVNIILVYYRHLTLPDGIYNIYFQQNINAYCDLISCLFYSLDHRKKTEEIKKIFLKSRNNFVFLLYIFSFADSS